MTPVYFDWKVPNEWSAITNFKILRELHRGYDDVKDSLVWNAMRVHAPKLICSTGVSSFQTFKRVFCMYSELHLHAAILS